VGGPYCDVAARGLMLHASRAALDRHLQDATEGTVDKTALFVQVEKTRGLFATLIGSAPEDVAYTRNVTDGIATFAASLDWREGDSVVLCEALEHPANVYPWYGISRKFGIAVKNVPPVCAGGVIIPWVNLSVTGNGGAYFSLFSSLFFFDPPNRFVQIPRDLS
jgi:selenocysteine lyase/cysteine desulfurase